MLFLLVDGSAEQWAGGRTPDELMLAAVALLELYAPSAQPSAEPDEHSDEGGSPLLWSAAVYGAPRPARAAPPSPSRPDATSLAELHACLRGAHVAAASCASPGWRELQSMCTLALGLDAWDSVSLHHSDRAGGYGDHIVLLAPALLGVGVELGVSTRGLDALITHARSKGICIHWVDSGCRSALQARPSDPLRAPEQGLRAARAAQMVERAAGSVVPLDWLLLHERAPLPLGLVLESALRPRGARGLPRVPPAAPRALVSLATLSLGEEALCALEAVHVHAGTSARALGALRLVCCAHAAAFPAELVRATASGEQLLLRAARCALQPAQPAGVDEGGAGALVWPALLHALATNGLCAVVEAQAHGAGGPRNAPEPEREAEGALLLLRPMTLFSASLHPLSARRARALALGEGEDVGASPSAEQAHGACAREPGSEGAEAAAAAPRRDSAAQDADTRTQEQARADDQRALAQSVESLVRLLSDLRGGAWMASGAGGESAHAGEEARAAEPDGGDADAWFGEHAELLEALRPVPWRQALAALGAAQSCVASRLTPAQVQARAQPAAEPAGTGAYPLVALGGASADAGAQAQAEHRLSDAEAAELRGRMAARLAARQRARAEAQRLAAAALAAAAAQRSEAPHMPPPPPPAQPPAPTLPPARAAQDGAAPGEGAAAAGFALVLAASSRRAPPAASRADGGAPLPQSVLLNLERLGAAADAEDVLFAFRAACDGLIDCAQWQSLLSALTEQLVPQALRVLGSMQPQRPQPPSAPSSWRRRTGRSPTSLHAALAAAAHAADARAAATPPRARTRSAGATPPPDGGPAAARGPVHTPQHAVLALVLRSGGSRADAGVAAGPAGAGDAAGAAPDGPPPASGFAGALDALEADISATLLREPSDMVRQYQASMAARGGDDGSQVELRQRREYQLQVALRLEMAMARAAASNAAAAEAAAAAPAAAPGVCEATSPGAAAAGGGVRRSPRRAAATPPCPAGSRAGSAAGAGHAALSRACRTALSQMLETLVLIDDEGRPEAQAFGEALRRRYATALPPFAKKLAALGLGSKAEAEAPAGGGAQYALVPAGREREDNLPAAGEGDAAGGPRDPYAEPRGASPGPAAGGGASRKRPALPPVAEGIRSYPARPAGAPARAHVLSRPTPARQRQELERRQKPGLVSHEGLVRMAQRRERAQQAERESRLNVRQLGRQVGQLHALPAMGSLLPPAHGARKRAHPQPAEAGPSGCALVQFSRRARLFDGSAELRPGGAGASGPGGARAAARFARRLPIGTPLVLVSETPSNARALGDGGGLASSVGAHRARGLFAADETIVAETPLLLR